MTVDLSRVKIYIRPGYTDLRKGVNGLTAVIQEEMELNPLSGSVFLFCNRSRKLLKAVWWDLTGFWLSQKPPTRKRVLRERQVSLAGTRAGGGRNQGGGSKDAAIGDRFLESP
ncbi:MAG: IS66 family insertion sequence element accessory protein TnpB [Treponema sp.]|jgi:transposase|nr:IS66 family insertion sequence element accessory protein TnpB [Treponema sp.]